MTDQSLFAELPAELHARRADLLDALEHEKDPTSWIKGDTYVRAYAPAAVAKILSGALHSWLDKRAIAFLWEEKMERNGKTVLGKASVASGKVEHFAKVDFVIELNFTAWQLLDLRQRIALVDHELMHCAVNGESLEPMMIPHDVEEFGAIVRRWGFWQPDLEEFAKVVQETAQLSLFPAP